jgi:hypothetical protein
MRHKIGRMRRLVYAFSKSIEHHRAAVALNYAHYNFCHVVKTLRVTPAMQAGIADHVWGIEEFFDQVMSAVPVGAPSMQPLAHRKPVTTSRELPGWRGFLRVVKVAEGPRAPTAPPMTSPAPAEQLGLFDNDPKTTA